jgi:hypothetical protein
MPKKKTKTKKRPHISKKKAKTALSAGALILVAAIGANALLRHYFASDPNAQGIEYLNALQSQDTSETLRSVEVLRQQNLADLVAQGVIDVFAQFQDFAIIGDSRVLGFSSYGYMNSAYVLAESGADVTYMEDYVSSIKNLQPKYIYIAYGINDLGRQIGKWDGQDGYGSVVEEEVDKLLEVDPEANIIINSIIQATPEAVENSPLWASVDEYNQELQELCEKRGWTYVDNSTICDYGNADIYQADGVHFYSGFYYTWAQNMITQTFFA